MLFALLLGFFPCLFVFAHKMLHIYLECLPTVCAKKNHVKQINKWATLFCWLHLVYFVWCGLFNVHSLSAAGIAPEKVNRFSPCYSYIRIRKEMCSLHNRNSSPQCRDHKWAYTRLDCGNITITSICRNFNREYRIIVLLTAKNTNALTNISTAATILLSLLLMLWRYRTNLFSFFFIIIIITIVFRWFDALSFINIWRRFDRSYCKHWWDVYLRQLRTQAQQQRNITKIKWTQKKA